MDKEKQYPDTNNFVSGQKLVAQIGDEFISMDNCAIEIDGKIVQVPLASKP